MILIRCWKRILNRLLFWRKFVELLMRIYRCELMIVCLIILIKLFGWYVNGYSFIWVFCCVWELCWCNWCGCWWDLMDVIMLYWMMLWELCFLCFVIVLFFWWKWRLRVKMLMNCLLIFCVWWRYWEFDCLEFFFGLDIVGNYMVGWLIIYVIGCFGGIIVFDCLDLVYLFGLVNVVFSSNFGFFVFCCFGC